jgi:hypothetical protein
MFLSGWVADPDDDKSIPDHQATVQPAVDGRPVVGAGGTVARADVSAVYPFVRQPVGWQAAAPVPDDGQVHEVCAIARNTGPGSDVVLGCRSMGPGVRDGGEPSGYVDAVSARPGLVRFTGWAGDPDAGATPTRVRLTLSGFRFEGWVAHGDRPDVRAARPDLANAGGFDGTLALPPGDYRWCLSAANQGTAGLSDTVIGCGFIVVPGPSGRVLGAVDASEYHHGGYDASTQTTQGWAWDPVARERPVVVLRTVSYNFERPPHDTTVVATGGIARPDVAAAVSGASPTTGWSADEQRFGKFGGPVYACAYAVIDLSEELIGCRASTPA